MSFLKRLFSFFWRDMKTVTSLPPSNTVLLATYMDLVKTHGKDSMVVEEFLMQHRRNAELVRLIDRVESITAQFVHDDPQPRKKDEMLEMGSDAAVRRELAQDAELLSRYFDIIEALGVSSAEARAFRMKHAGNSRLMRLITQTPPSA